MVSRARIVLVGVGALIAAGTLFALSPLRPPDWLTPWRVQQPLAFNHRVHVEELAFECSDCHLYALTSVRATIPNIDNCADCHEEMQGESAAEAALIEYIAAGEQVPWRKVYRVPEHVYFSHRRHTSIAAIECETCHGPVAELTEPVSRVFRRPTMNDCMDCHEQSGASNDCLHCHT